MEIVLAVRIDHAIVLIDERHARVGQRVEILDEPIELREVERSARDADDGALRVENRHGDRDDRHV